MAVYVAQAVKYHRHHLYDTLRIVHILDVLDFVIQAPTHQRENETERIGYVDRFNQFDNIAMIKHS